MKVCAPFRYPHWNEVSAVPMNSDLLEMYFMNTKSRKPLEFTDPLGRNHYKSISRFEINSEDTCLLICGNVQRWTHPLNKGKIPYTGIHDKIFTGHTTGYSPWDQVDMVELALMKFDNPENNLGTNGIYLMPNKFFRRFISIDWRIDKYKKLKDDIFRGLDKKTIILCDYEPFQYWIDNIPRRVDRRDPDTIGVALNWSQFQTRSNLEKIREDLIRINRSTGKRIHIKYHNSYKKDFESFTKDLDFIVHTRFEDLDKFTFMDMYETYIVDATGFGYELAHRVRRFNDDVSIFYFDGLEASRDEFLGVEEMGVVPTKTHEDLIKGSTKSWYPLGVVEESFPYSDSVFVPDELCKVILLSINQLKENK